LEFTMKLFAFGTRNRRLDGARDLRRAGEQRRAPTVGLIALVNGGRITTRR
jgi:hypothetical protein